MKTIDVSFLVITLLLLFGNNVLRFIDFDENRFQAIIITLSVVPAYLLMNQWKKRESFVLLLLFVVIASLVKLFTDRGEGTRTIVMSFVAAPIIMASVPLFFVKIPYKYFSFWQRTLKVFLYLYLVEVFVAFYERLSGHLVFFKTGGDILKTVGVEEFRSSSMYGHPLYNALMVSTAMAFVLISRLKPKYKFMLWGLGYVAILCFNTRGSIVGNLLFLGVYILYTVLMNRKMKDSTKSTIIIAGLMVAGMAFFLLSSGSVGGRLMTMGLIDDSSAQVRLDIIDFISDVSFYDFLWGMSYNDYTHMLLINNLTATENWWVDYLLRCGFLFLIIYVLLYALYLKDEFRYYKFFDKLFVTMSFLLIASTNNSLSFSFVALFYFLTLIRLFNPPVFRRVVSGKYLDL